MESSGSSRKIMVVADPSRESTVALQYALSHAVHGQDELILIHADNPKSWQKKISMFLRSHSHSNSRSAADAKASSPPSESIEPCPQGVRIARVASSSTEPQGGYTDFLDEMKHMCKAAQPNVRVRVERMDLEAYKDKAQAILFLSQSTVLGVDTIVIGQRRSLLGQRKSGGSEKGFKAMDTADYLIEKSNCTCVGVQKKGSKSRVSSEHQDSQEFLAPGIITRKSYELK